MSNNDFSENNKKPQNYTVQSDIVKKFLDTQIKELEIKQQSEENRKQIAKFNFELAKQSIQAQENDRKAEREYKKNFFKWAIVAGTIIFISSLCFFGFALIYNKEEFILEIVKILFYGGAGATAGISWEKFKQYSEPQDKNKKSK